METSLSVAESIASAARRAPRCAYIRTSVSKITVPPTPERLHHLWHRRAVFRPHAEEGTVLHPLAVHRRYRVEPPPDLSAIEDRDGLTTVQCLQNLLGLVPKVDD